MEREEIVREDFPAARRGWDPEAVRSHLEAIADRLSTAPTSVADAVAERVGEIIAAAEATASELEQQARREAEELVAGAKEEAQKRIEQAQTAVESLVSQAEELRSQVGSFAVGDRPATEPGPGASPAGATASAGPAESGPREPDATEAGGEGNGADAGAARLVAMNMALDGAEREEISARLAADFAGLQSADELVDDVLERAGRA